MKDLLLRHYTAIKNRGLITPETTLDQFMYKLVEEYQECVSQYSDDCNDNTLPSSDLIHELTDLAMVVLNCFTHYEIDFKEEVKKNLAIQESRVYIDSKHND